MKHCPGCSAEYADDIHFCSLDGSRLVAGAASGARLCPHCANSVPVAAEQCPYCNATLTGQGTAFQWSKDDDLREPTTLTGDIQRMPKSSKWLWVAGILLSALAGFFAGGYLQRNDLLHSMQEQMKDMQAKEQKIKTLEGQLAKVQQDTADGSKQLADLKNQLEENQKELAATQQKLAGAAKEAERLAATRVAAAQAAKPAQRQADPLPPARVANRPADPIPPAPKPAPARRGAEPGSYETVRATTVHQEPVNSSKVVSQIDKGTLVNVVRSSGDWLEVRSKHGNPPGFIRRDDAILVSRAN